MQMLVGLELHIKIIILSLVHIMYIYSVKLMCYTEHSTQD